MLLQYYVATYVGTHNIFVSFHLNKLLTTVELSVLAARVVELGLEPVYKSYVKALNASLAGKFDKFINLHQRVAYNRRWSVY